jgi:hypothetical protein
MDKKCNNCGYVFKSTKKYENSIYCHNCRKHHKKCEICGKEIFIQARTCSKKCAYELRKQSWIKTCGTEHNFCKNSSSRKKWEEKLLNEEGITNVWQRENVKEKSKKACLEKFGVENPSQSESIKQQKRQTFILNYPIIRKEKEEKGLWIPLSSLTEYEIYVHNVWNITNEQIKLYGNDLLKNKRNKNRSIPELKNKYTVDHKFSVSEGFKNKISPEIIGSIVNLEILSLSKNCSKCRKCSITLNQLINDYQNFINENKINKIS